MCSGANRATPSAVPADVDLRAIADIPHSVAAPVARRPAEFANAPSQVLVRQNPAVSSPRGAVDEVANRPSAGRRVDVVQRRGRRSVVRDVWTDPGPGRVEGRHDHGVGRAGDQFLDVALVDDGR